MSQLLTHSLPVQRGKEWKQNHGGGRRNSVMDSGVKHAKQNLTSLRVLPL